MGDSRIRLFHIILAVAMVGPAWLLLGVATPAEATGTAIRPVPTASSTTGPPERRASSR